jgi:hypothetical protein
MAHLYLLILVAEIMQKIGQLFLLRTNINTVGSVLDSPVSLGLLPFHVLTGPSSKIAVYRRVIQTFNPCMTPLEAI